MQSSKLRGFGKRSAAVTLAGASLMGIAAQGMSTAQALPDKYVGYESPKILDANTGQYTTVHFDVFHYGANNVLCVDSGLNLQQSLSAATQDSGNPKIAYLLQKYADTGSNIVAAGLSKYVRDALDTQKDVEMQGFNAFSADIQKEISDEEATLSAEADANAGPYSTDVNVTSSTVNFGLKSAAGNYQAGHTYTLTLSGPGQFLDGSTSKTGTTADSVSTWGWKSTGSGTVTANLSIDGIPTTSYSLYKQPDSATQNYVGASSSSASMTGSGSYTVAPTQPTATTPTITTEVSSQTANVGDSIHDTINASGYPANTAISGTDDLTDSSGNVVKTFDWSGTTDANGKLTAKTDDYTVTAAGTFVYVEHATAGKTADGKQTWPAVNGSSSDKSETVVVSQPQPTATTPTITTQVSSQTANVGDTIHDTINASGYPANTAIAGTDDLTDASGNVVKTFNWSGTTDADGKLTVNTDDYTVTAAGTFVYVEHAAAGTSADGKQTWPAIDGVKDDKAETVVVSTPVTPPTATTPTITTQVSEQSGNVGDSISDTINASGYPANEAISGTDDLTDASGNVVKTFNWSGTTDANGSLTTKTDPYTVTTAGTYVYVEHGAAGQDTAKNVTWPAVNGSSSDKSETVVVSTPTQPTQPTALTPAITTQVSEQSGNVGDSIYDTVNASGYPANTAISGTDDLTDASGNVVKSFNWSGTTDANGSLTTKTDAYTVTTAGTYVYVEHAAAGASTDGKTTWPAVDGSKDDKAETVVINTPTQPTQPTALTPSITTQVSEQSGNVGDSIYDTVNASGYPANTAISGTDDLTDASGNVVKTFNWSGTTDANGSLTTKTDAYTVTTAGKYVYVEHAAAGTSTDGKQTWPAVNGSPTDTAETVTLNTPQPTQPTALTPAITTQVSSQTANVGDSIYDTVSGTGYPANENVSGTDDLTDASGKVVKTFNWSGTTDANGSFTTKTDSYTVTEAGTFVYVEHAAAGQDTGKNVTWPAVNGSSSDKSETVVVSTPKPNITPLTPVITTATSEQTGAIGDSIYDNIKGSGYPANTAVSGTDALTDASGKVVTTVNWSGTTDANGAFDVKSPSYTVTQAGTFTWVESANGGSNTEHTWPAVKGGSHDKAETTVITPVTAVTQVQKQVVAPGETATDNVKISGAGANTVLSVGYQAYGMKDANANSCTSMSTADWAKAIADGDAKVFSAGSKDITGNGTVSLTTSAIPSGYNCVTFGETITSNGQTVATTTPGDKNEVVFVNTPKTTVVVPKKVMPKPVVVTPAPKPVVVKPVINTGDAGASSSNVDGIILGAGISLLGAASVIGGRRKKENA